ncbi:ester cyclase [Pseudonocardia adelaidensis]|uniref:SnoaL-like polyketide cyclase n=1 Tax=Pseudonocardia adelaidensis TaxID=648754 RepID=A0ABP9NTF6_9PSEU
MDAAHLIQLTTDTWNDRDLDGYLAAYHHDCEITAPGFVGKGHQGVTEFWTAFMTAFPDNRVLLPHPIIGAGDIGVEEPVLEGTHTGVLAGADGSEIPPTGRRISVPAAGVHTARDGRIVSSRFYYDTLELLTQLGVAAG